MTVNSKLAAAACALGLAAWMLTTAPVAEAQSAPKDAVCLKIGLTLTPAKRVEEWMRERQTEGYERFMSLPMGDSAGLMCAW